MAGWPNTLLFSQNGLRILCTVISQTHNVTNRHVGLVLPCNNMFTWLKRHWWSHGANSRSAWWMSQSTTTKHNQTLIFETETVNYYARPRKLLIGCLILLESVAYHKTTYMFLWYPTLSNKMTSPCLLYMGGCQFNFRKYHIEYSMYVLGYWILY